MANRSFAYDHPQYVVNQGAQVTCAATAASTDVLAGKFVAFAACKVKDIYGVVAVAGTADAAGWDIYNGTTSFADCTAGTAAAKATISVTMTEQTLAQGGYIQFKTKADSATLAGNFVVEYAITPGGNVTA